uniref:Uncharacterized protein n=1 Tax=Leptobrachium leishanense TaxID=445787 RepID=A0A8C5P7Y0_9ANUR
MQKRPASNKEHNKKTDALTSVIKSKEDEYKKQIQKMTCDMDVKLKLKEEEMKTSVCKKDEEMEKLRQQLKSLEREKQSELIKQQIEFNAKLAKIQSKPTKMYQDTSAVSHNIYKMKLQHMQEEKNLEIEGLRNRIKDLERQVSSVNDSRLKRRRF